MKRRVLSLVLVLTVFANMLTGCEGILKDAKTRDEIETANLNETINHDSKWINSTIEGAIDENSQLNLKDDFYSAYNKEWLLETHADKAHHRILGNKSMDVTNLRLLSILKGEEDPDAQGNAPVPAKDAAHDEEQVRIFAEAVMDWDSRNEAGVSNLKKYTDYIEAIDSVEELQEYFIGNNGQNLQQIGLVGLGTSAAMLDADHYYVYIGDEHDCAVSRATYSSMEAASTAVNKMDEQCGYILRKLGYSDSEVNDLFRKCFEFEAKLVDHQISEIYMAEKFWESEDSIKTVTMDEIQAMEGNYPLSEIIKAYGYENGRIVIPNPKYVMFIGKQLNEKNLETIKAYLLVNTVMDTQTILDRETYDYFAALRERDTKITEADKANNALSTMDQYYLDEVQNYLQGALDTVYVAKYCRQEEKEDLAQLTDAYIRKLHTIIDSEEWLSDDTKPYAHEKLDAITRNIYYPDEFLSYDYIDISKDDNLIDMVANINASRRGYDADILNQPVDRSRWDMDSEMGNTTYFNCFYKPVMNSINIYAGYLADSNVYNIDMSNEEKMAKVGVPVGHEITHGFDSNGAKFDKYGYKRNWWASSDKTKFNAKNAKIAYYYNPLSPYPGKTYGVFDATKVEGEVAADLGGIKISLEIGKDLGNFDNKAFFEYYTESYREKNTMTGAKSYDGNEHPISYIRTNVDIMQFDEFQKAFDIKEGDGMYMAPENRITVW